MAFVDWLEREYRNSARVYCRREEVRNISIQCPGFADDACDREKDVLEGLCCFASMGRLVLFERTKKERYAFMDVEKIVMLVENAAPEERLQEC